MEKIRNAGEWMLGKGWKGNYVFMVDVAVLKILFYCILFILYVSRKINRIDSVNR